MSNPWNLRLGDSSSSMHWERMEAHNVQIAKPMRTT